MSAAGLSNCPRCIRTLGVLVAVWLAMMWLVVSKLGARRQGSSALRESCHSDDEGTSPLSPRRFAIADIPR